MDVGNRIRIIRKQQKRTLEEIAEQCGFTKSLLSKIETGKTMPPVSTLMKISEALGVKVSDLLKDQHEMDTVFTTKEKMNEEHFIKTNKGYSFIAIAAERHEKSMQPYFFSAKRGEVTSHSLSHRGEEFIYMIEGEMKFKVGKTEYYLGPGDNLYFNSLEDHSLEPISDEVKYLAIFYEPK